VASKSLGEWLKILWENENEYVVCGALLCAVSVFLSLPRLGVRPPFIEQGGGGLHARRAT
jgi:hypothetical protein